MGEFIGVRVSPGAETLAVLSQSTYGDEHVDVLRLVDGDPVSVWPVERVSDLPQSARGALARCRVRKLYSWRCKSRIDGLWPLGMDGSVLAQEWREDIPNGACLVMRGPSGGELWVVGAFDLFPPEERGLDFHHSMFKDWWDWLERIEVAPGGSELCVFAKGGHHRWLRTLDGQVLDPVETK